MLSTDTLLTGNTLSPLQQRTAFRRLGYDGVPAPDTDIPADHCLQLWITMLLGRLSFLSPEQRDLLTEEMTPQLNGLGEAMMTGTDIGTPTLVIGDGRYATWHGKVGLLDLETGKTIERPPRDILESVAYNLAVLFARNRVACREIQERNHARRQHDTETP